MNKKFSALVSVLAFITPGFLVLSTVSPEALAQSGGSTGSGSSGNTGGSTGASGGQGTQSDGNRMGNPASNPTPGSGGSGLDTDSNSNDITPRPGSMMENRDQMSPTQQRPTQQRMDQTSPSQRRMDQMSPSQQRMDQMNPSQQRMDQMSPSQQRMDQMSPSNQQQMDQMNPGLNDNRINIQPNTTDNNSPFSSAAPRVLDSGSLGNYSHYVSITAGERPINSMTIAMPSDVNAIDDIIITNGSGDRVAAETTMNDGRLTVNFNQPLSAGEDIRVLMSGIQINSPIQRDGGILEYFVNVSPEGFTQPIPLGYTRVIMRDRSDNNDN